MLFNSYLLTLEWPQERFNSMTKGDAYIFRLKISRITRHICICFKSFFGAVICMYFTLLRYFQGHRLQEGESWGCKNLVHCSQTGQNLAVFLHRFSISRAKSVLWKSCFLTLCAPTWISTHVCCPHLWRAPWFPFPRHFASLFDFELGFTITIVT